MQAWALQFFLRKLGHNVITIDLEDKPRLSLKLLLKLGYRFLANIIGWRKGRIYPEALIPIATAHTRRFLNNHLYLTDVRLGEASLKGYFLTNEFDAVVVGSDQVWRKGNSSDLRNYFLKFIESKRTLKVAYACSFGIGNLDYNVHEMNDCSSLLKTFNAVGVREKSAQKICLSHFGVEANLVLDPTLLLEKRDYFELVGYDEKTSFSEGLFEYFLDESSEKLEVSREICQKLGITKKSFPIGKSICSTAKYENHEYVMPPVQDWILSFVNSEFVVTDSFHGVVFSIIFEKPFAVFINKARGADRFESLLSLLGLEDKIVNASTLKNKEFNTNPLSGSYKTKLSYLRENSTKFLKLSLE